ncbi:MAG: hypothetical protein A2Y12_06330 [Planctomycetes bacterium GWF2_42_9]|nr:MAG: hypothetical protein A2Y12_06330 [Planctomycetes bacterium GWF2_42_9]
MAHLYRRRKQYWIVYYLNGNRVQESLRTDNERIAKDKKKKLEYELALGDLHQSSKLPLPMILEAFCKYMLRIRTAKSYKNEVSRLGYFLARSVTLSSLCRQGADEQRTMLHL